MPTPSSSSEQEPRSPRDSTGLARLLGVVLLTLCALGGYFAIAAEYLDEDAYGPADHALVTGLRLLAGACAIPSFACVLVMLNLRDQAIMRDQDAARESSAPPSGQPRS
ncbi:hypothetical protein [Nocardioides halotolerans]|jgi:hypothetical protein|uniref:hypothetical protein n=1 Tax=Nocardioides halotolerans TaxID=433660 RepID=UPI00041AA4EC|nr:hypothetical protein [Nocardioides halotolerans]